MGRRHCGGRWPSGNSCMARHCGCGPSTARSMPAAIPIMWHSELVKAADGTFQSKISPALIRLIATDTAHVAAADVRTRYLAYLDALAPVVATLSADSAAAVEPWRCAGQAGRQGSGSGGRSRGLSTGDRRLAPLAQPAGRRREPGGQKVVIRRLKRSRSTDNSAPPCRS